MNINKTIACVLGLAGMVSIQNAEAQFKIVGYSAYYDNSGPSATQYGQVTHVDYAFLAPNSNGSLQTVPNLSRMQSIVSAGHAAGVKVMISCQTTAATWGALAYNSGYLSTFVNNMVNFCNQYNLDGVDIDWEFPSPAPSTSATDYANLMSQLGTALHNDGKLLTAAVASWGSEASGVTSSVFNSVDWLNIMDYDNTGGTGMSTLASVTTAIDYWEGQGLPASKIVMGVPFYGDPSEDDYSQLLSLGASPNSDSWNGNGYNGIPTIEAKTLLCQQQGLGGMMIWTLGGDATGANSLLTFMYSASHPTQLPNGGTYRIYNANSGMALDDTGGSTTNGTIMQQWTSSNTDVNQEWEINSWGNGYYGIKNIHSGLTLDDAGWSTTDGTFVQQWAQGNAQANQEWAFIPNPDGTFQIVNLYSMMDLQIANFGTQNGDQATQWSWGNNTSQEWWIFLNGNDQ
jgi:chitinase